MSKRTPPNGTVLDNWVFENFISGDKPFAKALRISETCVIVYVEMLMLVSSLEFPIKFVEKFKVTSVPFFIPDFDLLRCKLDNFTFNMLYWVIFY